MRIRLGHSKYGPTAVRLLRLSRKGSRHEIKEATLAIEFEGDFESAHTSGDNTQNSARRHHQKHRLRPRKTIFARANRGICDRI